MATAPRPPLSERSRPTRLEDVIGNPRARADLRAWADRWRSGVPTGIRAALLSGPPGVGKTSAALALAADLGWTVVEMNASDARNEGAIQQVAGRASISHTLFEPVPGGAPRRALIVLDEADSLSGRATETARVVRTPPSLREFLRGRYGTIESLNTAWGLSPTEKPVAFERWDEVPRSPGNFAWARRPAPRKDIEEWRGLGRPPDSSDRGGMGAITRLVRSTRQPLVLIVNDDRVLTRYSSVFRTGVARIRFHPIAERELTSHLSAIARRERITLAPGALEAIVRRSRGDLRAAINDLEAIAPLPATEVQLTILGFRDLTADFEAVTEEALTAARFYRSVEIRDRLDAPPDDLLPWIEENIPHFAPDPGHRADAFDHLAVAERLLGRARRWRVWGLWSYATEVLTGGVGLAIRDRPSASVGHPYFPGFLGEMGRSRTARATRDAIMAKAGARLHLSKAKGRESVLPFLESMFVGVSDARTTARRTAFAADVVRELVLTPEEVGYLTHAPADSTIVARLFDAAPPEASDADEARPPADTAGARRRVQRHLTEYGRP
jgi:DNA polymerase III delta prime subunit